MLKRERQAYNVPQANLHNKVCLNALCCKKDVAENAVNLITPSRKTIYLITGFTANE
jgi:hypothetical protein